VRGSASRLLAARGFAEEIEELLGEPA